MNFNFGIIFCSALLGFVIYLYFQDPDIFISRLLIRTHRIRFLLRTQFESNYKKKYRKLNSTIQFCQEAISKYANKKNLSNLSEDQTIQELLSIYRELMDFQKLPECELTLETIDKRFSTISHLYDPWMDPYYDESFDEEMESA